VENQARVAQEGGLILERLLQPGKQRARALLLLEAALDRGRDVFDGLRRRRVLEARLACLHHRWRLQGNGQRRQPSEHPPHGEGF
jgi:hypothetical protein